MRESGRALLLCRSGKGAREADEFEARGGFLDDVEAIFSYHDGITLRRNSACSMEDVAGDGLVGVVLGQFEVEAFVDIGYLASCGEFVYTRLYLTRCEAGFVVLIFDVATDFFHEVFECEHTCSAPELVDNDSYGTFLL